jgi:hypothetical protein
VELVSNQTFLSISNPTSLELMINWILGRLPPWMPLFHGLTSGGGAEENVRKGA